MPTTIGLFGTGRLGSAIRAAADARDDLVLAWARGRSRSEDRPDGVEPPDAVDVAIDVSHPDAVESHLRWAAATGTPLVVGTTGWDLELLRGTGGQSTTQMPVLLAPNFSLGVALVRRFALALGGYAAGGVEVDLAVTETHHRRKVDAPSGTAITLREALATGAQRDLQDIQTTSLRLGSVIGDHEVVASSPLETISIRHVAHSRELFAAGALTAAAWLRNRPAGLYTLDDLAEDTLLSLLGASSSQVPTSAAGTSAA